MAWRKTATFAYYPDSLDKELNIFYRGLGNEGRRGRGERRGEVRRGELKKEKESNKTYQKDKKQKGKKLTSNLALNQSVKYGDAYGDYLFPISLGSGGGMRGYHPLKEYSFQVCK